MAIRTKVGWKSEFFLKSSSLFLHFLCLTLPMVSSQISPRICMVDQGQTFCLDATLLEISMLMKDIGSLYRTSMKNFLLPNWKVNSRDPLRAKAITKEQKEALEKYHNASAFPQPAYDNAKGINFPYIEDVGPVLNWEDCVNDSKKLMVKEGRRSFPSGHTSFVFAGAMFCALYSGYWIGTWQSSLKLGMGKETRNFPGVSAKLATVFVFFLPAIYVGASRTQVRSNITAFH